MEKIKSKFKKKDNYDKNKQKINREMFRSGKETKEQLIEKSKENQQKAKLLPKYQNLKNDNSNEIPSQVIIKFISMEGKELNNEETLTNELTLPTEITSYDLNKLMNNELLKNETPELYQFYINDIEIKNNLKETLAKIKNFSSEEVYKIVYCPQSLFRVKPLTRGGSILEGHTDSILIVQFSPSGEILASGGGDSIVRFWDMNTDTQITDNTEEFLNVHKYWIECLQFSPCGQFLVSGDSEGYFSVWDANTLKPMCKRSVKAHSKWIASISWRPLHLYKTNNDNNETEMFITCGKDGFIKMWFARIMKINISTKAHESPITKCIWSGEDLIYSCSEDQTVRIFDNKLNALKILKGHSHWVNTMAINTDYLLRTGCFDFDDCKVSNGDFYKYASEIKEKNYKEKVSLALKRYNKFKEKINSSEKILTGSDDYTLILWDQKVSDLPIIRMTGHQGIVNDVKFSPNAFYLASASFDSIIKIWNANNGNFLFNLRGHVGPVYQISWSPNSKMLLSGSKDSTLQCWNIDTKKMMHNLPGHADEVYTVDWSPNGIKAASGSKDQRIRIWVN